MAEILQHLLISIGITTFLNLVYYLLFQAYFDLIGWIGVFTVAYFTCYNHMKKNEVKDDDKFDIDVRIEKKKRP